MCNVKQITDRLYRGFIDVDLPVSIELEYRADIGAEVWCVYIDLNTATIEQAKLLASDISTNDLPEHIREIL